LNLACSGLNVTADKALWTGLAKPQTALRNALDLLYDEFRQAPVLGSLLNPSASIAARLVDMAELQPALQQSLQGEDGTAYEAAVAAQGLASAAALLGKQYTLVITNVPYLARGKQGDALREFCEKHYPEAKNDLATVFLERCLGLCATGGTASIVLPQNWLFLTTYKKFREKLLKQHVWHTVARLGEKGFESTAAAGAFVAMLTLSRGKASMPVGGLMGEKPKAHFLRGLDVSKAPTAQDKADGLRVEAVQGVEQAKQLENPDARVALGEVTGELLEKYGLAYIGQRSGDGLRFILFHWEFGCISQGWEKFSTTVDGTTPYSGNTQCFLWENGKGQLAEYQAELARTQYASGGWKQGWQAWGVTGVRISQMRVLPVTIHHASHFDNNTATLVPHNPAHLAAIWCFCSSPEYNEAVRRIDQKLNVTNATLVKVPFDLDHWTAVAAEKIPPRPAQALYR